MRSRVALFEQIRRDSRVEGLSVRALAKRHRVHRRTVRQALTSAVPPTPARRSWQRTKVTPFTTAIDEMLRADLTAPRKQRHTVVRILARLVDEHGATDLTYRTVRTYVAQRRPPINAEAGRPPPEVFIAQIHQPGAEAEVDFAELWVDLPAGRTKCYLFTMRLCFSGRAVHRVFATQSQEAFLEGHIEAFTELGGVPTKHVKYDNLKSAVTTVLFGTDRRRTENDRWVLFRSHYGFALPLTPAAPAATAADSSDPVAGGFVICDSVGFLAGRRGLTWSGGKTLWDHLHWTLPATAGPMRGRRTSSQSRWRTPTG